MKQKKSWLEQEREREIDSVGISRGYNTKKVHGSPREREIHERFINSLKNLGRASVEASVSSEEFVKAYQRIYGKN